MSTDDRRALLQSALRAIDDLQAKLDRAEAAGREPIAIVGMSCRFPGGATSPEAYWELLRSGRDVVGGYPAERLAAVAAAGVDVGMLGDASNWHGGFLDEIDQFDPQFFGISPREAATMDPQQRMVLEVSWEALERAGIAPDSLSGSATGVFVGITTNEYVQLAKLGGPGALDVYSATGGALNAAPGRVAYTLGLQGPCMAIDTACSSSLVALHEACHSLRLGESDLALAGGVNLLLLPEAFVCFEQWGMMAPDGRCKTFDAAADGFVRGEGCGMVVLKRLRDAVADGDPVLAVVRGSAVNQDGRSSGLTVPNGPAQQAVLRRALDVAGVAPEAVQYFEAHGTGTTLGDPIEIEAMGAVLGPGRGPDDTLVIGSVKTNIGHLESASGIAGVIKVVLSMQHGEIPPHLHFHEPSPKIPWPAFPMVVPTALTEWPEVDGRRLAGVSGFGFSGTNAHVVLESAPAPVAPPEPVTAGPIGVTANVLTLSARTETGLRALAARTATWLTEHPDLALADACTTANTGRAHLAQRAAVVAGSNAQLTERLTLLGEGTVGQGVVAARARRPRIAFLFTGQGAQYAGMARGLYDVEPVFRTALDRVAALMAPLLDVALLDVLFAEPGSEHAALLDQTGYTQPALFAVEHSLAALFGAWGVEPDVLLGHSVGEVVAATVAGVLSLEDAVRLIVARGALMQALPAGGAMTAIFAPHEQVEAALAGRADIAVAAVNGPAHTVVSGAASAVQAASDEFAGRGVRVQALTVSHAFHSPLMTPMLDEFRRVAETISYRSPQRRVVSNVTGAVAGAELAGASYWVRHVMAPVRFADGVVAVRETGCDVLVEIGPHPVLSGMGAACLPDPAVTFVPSLRRGRDDLEQVLAALGTVHVHGGRVAWGQVRPGGRRLALPTAEFERQRYWLDPAPARRRGPAPDAHPLLGSTIEVPVLGATIHETYLAVDGPAWLGDHRLAGTPVVPGSAFLEIAVAAQPGAVLDTLALHEALLLPDDGAIAVQSVVTEAANGARTVQITSRRSDGSVCVHAVGTLRAAPGAGGPHRVDPSTLLAGLDTEIDVEQYYDALWHAGLTYGPAFRGLVRLVRADGAAAGRAVLPAVVTDAAHYHLHPALLDACFHVLGAAILDPSEAGDDMGDDMYVPVAVHGLRVERRGATDLWCAVRIVDRSANGTLITACVDLYDAGGEPVASIERLEVRHTTRAVWERTVASVKEAPLGAATEIAWRAQPLPGDAPGETVARWLVVSDDPAVAEESAELASELVAAELVRLDGDRAAADRLRLDDALSATAGAGAVGVVALRTSLPSTLALVQILAAAAGEARLDVVTRGACSVDGEAPDVDAATVAGFARVVANELPALRCRTVDLDPTAEPDAAGLAAELLGGRPFGAPLEQQVARRANARWVARLQPLDPGAHAPVPTPGRLDLGGRGSFEQLGYVAAARRKPGAGEVEIEVRATGLNFRDVLNVLGMYPGDPGTPGLECAGVVVATGPGVDAPRVGTSVLAIAPSAFDTHVVTRAELVVDKPAALSFAEAATLPIAYLTASYGLQRLAGLRAGERVLIHAAAGGVGWAAVTIAQRLGAEVFATVGSARKRRALQARGVHHLYSSRTPEFAAQVLADTGGEGVDVVLNSLSDELIDAGFAALAPEGRFLEIGKRDIWSAEQAAAVRPGAGYYVYDLADFLAEDIGGVHAALRDLVDEVAAGSAAPLPVRAFGAYEVGAAFRYMAQARHIGKVVVVHRADAPRVRTDGSYLVTGGLGGIGLAVGAWLVEQGAGTITLAGRRGPDVAAQENIAAWRESGADVRVVQADVADPAGVAAMLDAATGAGEPLRGVFHAAGITDDGAIGRQTWERFAGVLAPKVTGAALLDAATAGFDLDHFVLFSSASAVLGRPGQSNYAAANGGLDAFAHIRRAAGRRALAVDWGAWAEVGMASRLAERERQRLTERGVGALPTAVALDSLGRLLDLDAGQAAVLAIDWPTMTAAAGADGLPPLLDEVTALPSRTGAARRADTATSASLLAALREVPDGDHAAVVRDHVVEQLVLVLDLPTADVVEDEQDLAELGMDSLMAVELTNRLRSSTGLNLAATLAIERPSVRAIVDYLLELLGDPAAPGTLGATGKRAGEPDVVPVPRDRPLPVSSAQQRLLFFDQFAPGLAVFNLPIVVRLRGPLDVAALAAAVNGLVGRHESLRTNFEVVDGTHVQVVVDADDVDVPLVVHDAVGAADALVEMLRPELARPFDLAHGLKLRAALFRVDDGDHVLAMTMHHIATDGWSVARLIDELGVRYSAAVEGRPHGLGDLDLQYADWSAWQHEVEASSIRADGLQFWTAQLGGALPVLDLPADHPRPPLQTYRSGSVRFHLEPELMEAVRAAARDAGVTPFVLLLASYVATLARWSGQDDIVVGTASANRARPEVHDVVGLFVNMIAIRTGVDLARPFSELVEAVKVAARDAFVHESVPFDQIVEALNPARDLSRSMIFQTAFVLNNMPIPDVRLSGLDAELIDMSAGATEYDLACWVSQLGDRGQAVVEYNADLFDAETIDRFTEQWQLLLRAAIATPDAATGELAMLPTAERELLMGGFGVTDPAARGVSGVSRLDELVSLRALVSPDAVAFEHCGEVLSYGELDAGANRLARRLLAEGVGAGDRVGVAVGRSNAMVLAVLAVLKAGGAYVPLDPELPPDRLAFMVADAGVAAVVVSGDAVGGWLDGVPRVIDLVREAAAVAVLDDSSPGVDTSHLPGGGAAWVIYTSGSTGRPKGVEVEHASAINFVLAMAECPGMGEDDVVLAVPTLSFDPSVLDLFLPAVAGARVVIASREETMEGRRLARLIESSRATVMQGTPTTWSMLLASGWAGSPRLTALCGGEDMPVSLGRRLRELCRSVWNVYGPTETTVWSTVHEVTDASLGRARVPVGRPIPGMVFRVVDGAGGLAPVGVPGELFIGGIGVARGYLNRPELTAERFVTDPFDPTGRVYRTGDFARWLPDGNLEFLGRRDFQVKVRGNRIELGEIEAAFRADDGIADAVVVADGQGQELRLVAYVVPVRGAALTVSGLRATLQRRLPDPMVPSAFVVLDAFPLTASRKIDRAALPRPDAAAAVASAEYVAPRTDIERVVAGIIADTLDIERVGVDDDFFELGGHSLHATSVIAKIEATLGVAIELRSFFTTPTVAAVATIVEGGGVGAVVVPPIVRVSRDVPLPVSSAQQRLLFFDRFAPGLAIYNLPIVARLRGPLNVEALAAAVNGLVRRHEALRTDFEVVDGAYVQVVVDADDVDVPLVVHDAHGGADELVEMLRPELTRPFDLAHGLKLRAAVFRIGDGDHVLAITMHHIATDGWSVARLVDELAIRYSAAVEGFPHGLGDLDLQYADWSAWQHEVEASSLRADGLQFWTEQLGGALPVLDLPADHPRPRLQTYHSGSVRFHLEPELMEAVRAAARAAGVTPFVFLLSSYVATLARWSGQDDIIVGTASANRARPEMHDVVGLFVNMIAIRTGVDLARPFSELVEAVKVAARDAFAHESVPFDRIVEALNPARDLSRSIVFQTLFVLNNMPIPDAGLSGLDVEIVDLSVGATEYDLACWMTELGDRGRAVVEYNADVFDVETIERFTEQWQLLLRAAVATPEAPTGQLPLLSSGEREQLLGEWAWGPRDVVEGPARLEQLVARQAVVSPEAVAVAAGGESVTYAELVARSRRVARALVARGVLPGDRVGVAVERAVDMVVAVLAVLETGAAYVPLDTAFPAERLAFMIDDAGLRVAVVSGGSLAARVDVSALELVDVVADREVIAAFDDAALDVDTSALPRGGVAYVIYTSGSTGRPKGVEVEHASVVNFVHSTRREPRISADDVLLAVITLSFDMSVFELFVPLAAGARVVVADRDDVLDGRRLARLIESYGVTLMYATPTTWSMLFASGWAGAPGLRVVSGGEAMSDELGRRLLECCGEVWNMYGPTETTVYSTGQRVEAASLERAIVPVGRPIANTVCRVLDTADGLAPVGVPGELFIGGVGVARGYLNRPELTAERFIADPFDPTGRLYRTGDLARWLPDGTLEFLGRLDFQVKVRGHRIELGEIESTLRGHGAVADAVVVADGSAADARLLAYVVAADALPASGDLRTWLQQRLPDYMIPSAFVVLDALPLTPNRKIDRNALPRPDAAAAVASAEYVAPRTDIERVVAEIIADTLDIERVGVDDDFFELGGHSLHATSVIAKIEATLGVAIELRSFFTTPTVAAVAAIVEGGGVGAVVVPPIVRVSRDVPLPVSSAQQRLLFFDRFAPGLAIYNLPIVARLRGPLNVEALAAAVNGLVRRHEALRTDFEVVDGAYVQVVVDADDVDVPLVVHDAHGGADELVEMLRPELTRPFDLAHGLKLRAAVFRIGDGDHVLAITMHHIATDGWSVARLVDELAIRYSAAVEGFPHGLGDLDLQYADWSAWQHEVEASSLRADGLQFWTEQLGGALPVLDLPADHPRPRLQTYHSGSVRFHLEPELMEAVRAAARAAGVTPFVFLLSSYVATLARWSGQDDIIVGTASANRARPEMHDVVGLFVNMIAIRTGVDLARPFSELVEAVKVAARDAFAHESVPFDRIVEALNPARDLSRSIVFQTLFVLNNMPIPDAGLSGLDVEIVDLSVGATEYDLACWMTELGDRGRAVVEYNADVFDVETIERFTEQWQLLLRAAVATPEAPTGQLPLLSSGEREQLLGEWAWGPRDVVEGPARLEQLVARQAVVSPEAVAVAAGGESVTYAELVARSRRVARALVARGVLPGDRVGVAVERAVDMVVAVLAVLETGAAYVPLDTAFPAERLAFMIDDAGLRVAVVSGGSLAARVDVSALELVDVVADREVIAAFDDAALDVDTSALPRGGVAYVIYTSGSTGRPKGVEVEHASVVNFVHSTRREPRISADDVLLAVITLSFDMSVFELFVPLAAGARVVVADRDDVLDGRRLARLIESYGVTLMYATPTTWSMLFASGWAGAPGLRVVSGGEAMSDELGRRLLECCGEVWNMYGPTETTVYSTGQRVEAASLERAIVPVGRPIANTVCRVLDTADGLAPVGVPGELFIGGVGVARGYLNRPELTAERFIADPFDPTGRLYRTGDLARWLPDGTLEFLGRLDFQVKVRGHRIELGEIESALRGHGAVADAVVVADGSAADARLLAYVVAADALPASGDLRTWLQQRLPDYMIPSLFIEVDEFPLTPNRKIDRNALPRPDAAAAVASAEYVAPRTDIERVVAEIIADTLDIERVGVDDDFFELGGHSLHATSVIAKIEATLGVAIELRSFFTTPTVAGAAATLTADPSTSSRIERVAQLRVQLASMSPDEVAALLAARRNAGEHERP